MDWTQAELAQRVGYSVATIRKLERDELRPSKPLAELLAHGLDVAITHRSSFVSFARSTPTSPLEPDAQPTHTQRRSNLPAQLTPFFGRTAEIVELTQYLTNFAARLITIVGPGGMGKTRLALEVAQSILDVQIQTDSTGTQKSNIKHQTYADGVYFVALAPLRATEHIVPAIAEAINLRFQADNRPPKQQLLDYLRHKQVLLVLDNFEHLQAGAELVLELLQACPRLRMLVTSREHLQLSSETLFVLESMALPSAATLPDVLSYSAVQLFVETACRVRPKFIPTITNVQAIVRICKLVDGMPLGIILAAAWVDVLSPNDIVTELSQGFDFLAAELRDLPERQRSMRAVLSQSWQRLTEAERTVVMRLAIFRGGFTRVAAQHVAGASVRMLSSFVSKSLVQCEPDRRYTMHEFLRQFAEAELEAAGEADTIGRTHALYYLAMAEQAEGDFHRAEQRAWLDRLDAEHANLRAALSWSVAASERAPIALRLTAALHLFWLNRGPLDEGLRWAERALALSWPEEQREARAAALNAAGRQAIDTNDLDVAEQFLTESLALYEQLEDLRSRSEVLSHLGDVHHWRGDLERAASYQQASLCTAEAAGSPERAGWALHALGIYRANQGQLEEAIRLLDQSKTAFDETGGSMARNLLLATNGYIQWQRGDAAGASRSLTESQRVAREEVGCQPEIEPLLLLAEIARAQGRDTEAQALLEQSLTLAQEYGQQRHVALAHYELCLLTLARGDADKAQAHLQASLTGLRVFSNAWNNVGMLISGSVTLGAGLFSMSRRHYSAYLASPQASGTVPAQRKSALALALTALATVLALEAEGNNLHAARLWGASTEVYMSRCVLPFGPTVLSLPGLDSALVQRAQDHARTQSDQAIFAAAWAEGQAMTLDDAVAYALVNFGLTTDGSPVVSMNITDRTGLSPIQTASLKNV